MSRSQVRLLDTARLREARTAADLTQEGLARALDVTLRTIQRWEDGTSEPRGAQLLHLAARLGLTADDLYHDRRAA